VPQPQLLNQNLLFANLPQAKMLLPLFDPHRHQLVVLKDVCCFETRPSADDRLCHESSCAHGVDGAIGRCVVFLLH
jgi:hypothetical protein